MSVLCPSVRILMPSNGAPRDRRNLIYQSLLRLGAEEHDNAISAFGIGGADEGAAPLIHRRVAELELLRPQMNFFHFLFALGLITMARSTPEYPAEQAA